MSGRLYDSEDGIPICKCGKEALRSIETNFNGIFCPHCEKWGEIKEFRVNHPLWIAWKKFMDSRRGKLVYFDGFIKFKKKYNLQKQHN